MKPGESLDGRYTIIERLGAGGMGEVYKATHTILDAPRVIKVVHPQISASEDARDRFLREARAATKVQHQNVATMHDFASMPDGSHYMVWEFIDGTNLAQRLRSRGTLPPRQALRIAIQALHGLDAIHRAGIIHRDISPENLMITATDEVKIIDLGVAKVEGTEAVSQTRTGIFVGKLRYAAPEQLGFLPEGERVDARADLYAVAMVLVEMLTGRPPYEAKSPHEYFILHAREPRPRTVELPADLPGSSAIEAVLEKALSRDRNVRYSNAREFAAALEEIERTLPAGGDLPTMAVSLDGERTMMQTPVDTLYRTTQRTDAQAAPTVRTPFPAPPSATAPRKGTNSAYIVAIVGVLALVAGAAIFWPRDRNRPSVAGSPVPAQPPSQSVGATAAPQSDITVTSTQNESEPVITERQVSERQVSIPETVTRTTAPVVRPQQTEHVPPPAADENKAENDAARTSRSSAAVPTYVDGGGDDERNERALEQLRAELQGTRKVAVRAGAMQIALTRELREHFPDLEFAAYAPVVIRFDGTVERMGRGRKRRAATAIVTKNDRVVFRYELPEEIYRVGMTPTEAFSRILADAME